MTCGVYSIMHRRSGKRYVGSSYDVERRLQDHTKSLRDGDHYNVLLQRAWKKYGESEFRFSILASCRREELLKREQHWIDELNACDTKFGYNLAPIAGSALGVRWSDQSKAARSAVMKEFFKDPQARAMQSEKIKAAFARNPELGSRLGRSGGAYRKGRPLSDEHKARISAARLGHEVSEETRSKIAASLLGRKYVVRTQGAAATTGQPRTGD